MNQSTSAFVTYSELSKKTGINEEMLRRLYKDGKIDGVKLGHRSLYFSVERVMEQLNKMGSKTEKNRRE